MGYASDLRDEAWAILEPLVEPKQKGRPRKHSLRSICNAIRYVPRTGCQWRLLPVDLPPGLVVYMTFWHWRNCGLWERVRHQLRRRVRVQAGRKPDPTLAIIDSQSRRGKRGATRVPWRQENQRPQAPFSGRYHGLAPWLWPFMRPASRTRAGLTWF
jgi:transposase